MVYEAAEFVRLIDQLQQALENDSTDGIPSLIRHSWLKASCLELEIMDTVRRQQNILFRQTTEVCRFHSKKSFLHHKQR